jgi:hypothetical protein
LEIFFLDAKINFKKQLPLPKLLIWQLAILSGKIVSYSHQKQSYLLVGEAVTKWSPQSKHPAQPFHGVFGSMWAHREY